MYEKIYKSLRNELFFWKYVIQSRLGFNIYKFIEKVSNVDLDALCLDQGAGDYDDRLSSSDIGITDLFKRIDKCDSAFRIYPQEWPSDSDFFILYGNSVCVTKTFEEFSEDVRPSKNIFLVKTEDKATTLNEEQIMDKELDKLGFSSVTIASIDRLLNILENLKDKKVCFVLGFELCNCKTFSSLHHHGGAEVLQQIIASCKKSDSSDNIHVVLVGQSYKLVDFDFDIYSQMSFSTLRGEDITHVLTEKGIWRKNQDGKWEETIVNDKNK